MKKIISTLLALVMALSLTTVAFAANPAKQDESNTFTKKYTVTNGIAPAETFGFTATYKSYEGETATPSAVPEVTLGTADFAASGVTSTKDVSVSIGSVENAPLGVYTYEITENVPDTKTAGVTYNNKPIYLVLTVLRDEASNKHYVAAIHYEADNGGMGLKTGEIVNSYDAGNLTVTKQIGGNMADMSKKFEFTITLNAPKGTAFDGTVQNAIAKSGVQAKKVEYDNAKSSVTITVDLGDDDSINITNIPVGTTYEVSENAAGYDTEHADMTKGTIAGGDEVDDTWTNTKTSTVDTGINMDSLPYILLLAVACVGLFVFFTKKRSMREN